MNAILSSILLISAALLASGDKVRYDNYKVMRMTPRTTQELQALHQLETLGASFWEEPSKVGRAADIMFPPHLQNLVPEFQKSGMKVESFIEDVQQLIDLTDKQQAERGPNAVFDKYHTLQEIYDFLDAEAAAQPNIASTFSIGQTAEGRELKVLKISRGANKPVIWVDANIHAREWITSGVAIYLIDQLLNNQDAEIRSWSEDFDWYFLTVTNPDGFEYTKSTDRLWRKTRATNAGSTCKGADANRNFGYHWGEGGSSSSPCSETFMGSSAFSEIESQHIADFIDSIAKDLVFYLSLHSYSQLILLPFGYTDDHISQYDTYMQLAAQAAAKHKVRYGTVFEWGNTVDILYQCSGITMDWAKGAHNVNLTLTYELRDTGRYGFLLPPDQIVPSSEELVDGLGVYIDALRAGITTPPLPPQVAPGKFLRR